MYAGAVGYFEMYGYIFPLFEMNDFPRMVGLVCFGFF